MENSKYEKNLNNSNRLNINMHLLESKLHGIKSDVFYYFVIDMNTLDDSSKQKVLILLKEIYHNNIVFELLNLTVFLYFEKSDINIKDIIDPLVDDFAIKIKLLNGGKTSTHSPYHFLQIFEAYLEYSIKNPRIYTDYATLITDIIKVDFNKLSSIKPAILNNIYGDTHLINLIHTFLNNNLNVTQTAKELYMHRNTINNKLDFIKNESSLNIQDFNEAVAMYWLIISK